MSEKNYHPDLGDQLIAAINADQLDEITINLEAAAQLLHLTVEELAAAVQGRWLEVTPDWPFVWVSLQALLSFCIEQEPDIFERRTRALKGDD